MDRKAAPGPWRFGAGEDWGYILAADGTIVAGGDWYEGFMGDDDPNNVLMCAAPELRAALRGVLHDLIGPNEDAGTWDEGSQVRKALELLARLDK